MQPIFHGRVDDGGRVQWALGEDDRRRAHLHGFAGEAIEAIFRRPKRQRTYDQLKYWFGVPMTILSEQTGYTKMQMHYLCLAICFGVVIDQASGREVPVVPASRALSPKQFADLIEWCPPWAFEAYDGLEIPMPNEIDLGSLPGPEEEAA